MDKIKEHIKEKHVEEIMEEDKSLKYSTENIIQKSRVGSKNAFMEKLGDSIGKVHINK